jgi:hypothetical protein
MRRRARSGRSNRQTQPLRPDQKKYGDAETLLVRGCEGLKQRQAEMPSRIRTARLKEAVERLVALYDSTGNKAEAAVWRRKLDEVNKDTGNGKPTKSTCETE